MATAAVPQILGDDFRDCPPGHRYTLYGAFWQQNWHLVEKTKLEEHTKPFAPCATEQSQALRARQTALISHLGPEQTATFDAISVSPFVTGTGIEHPLENGMAFLNPYGLPYLPGASVKGVLRRAAEELAGDAPGVDWGDTRGWTSEAVAALFGPDQGELQRGALTFWDVIPDCKRLRIEIMNPHYSDYYQGKSTPHDAGIPPSRVGQARAYPQENRWIAKPMTSNHVSP